MSHKIYSNSELDHAIDSWKDLDTIPNDSSTKVGKKTLPFMYGVDTPKKNISDNSGLESILKEYNQKFDEMNSGNPVIIESCKARRTGEEITSIEVKVGQPRVVSKTSNELAWEGIENKGIVGIGKKLYAVEKLMGEGTFCEVYRAIDPDGEIVALKVLKKEYLEGSEEQDFINEIDMLRNVGDYENIVSLKGVRSEPGFLASVLEYVPSTLKDCKISDELVSSYVSECASTLKHLDEHSIVHLDIKPENVGITGEGALRLIDFAGARSTAMYAIKNFYYTKRYLAPELRELGMFRSKDSYIPKPDSSTKTHQSDFKPQEFAKCLQRIGVKTDIYAFGRTLEHFLTGGRLSESSDVACERVAMIYGDNVPSSIYQILSGTLEENPDERIGIDELINLSSKLVEEVDGAEVFKEELRDEYKRKVGSIPQKMLSD